MQDGLVPTDPMRVWRKSAGEEDYARNTLPAMLEIRVPLFYKSECARRAESLFTAEYAEKAEEYGRSRGTRR